MNVTTQVALLQQGDFKTLARIISWVENDVTGYEDVLKQLKPSTAKIIGITGAPGAGKSSLVDALIGEMVAAGKKVAVICVDPSSPFNRGALLGDRIRMNEWYNHPGVFIRSLASKGSLGGLHPKMIGISDVVTAAGFDYVIIETVGVGQSEVDIAALADITVVMLVPEGGDVIQTMKAGLMEVADIFVINKYDRPDAEQYYNNLMQMLAPVFHGAQKEIPVVKTIALTREGIPELFGLVSGWDAAPSADRKIDLLTEKLWSIIQNNKMKVINKEALKQELAAAAGTDDFNIYRFAERYLQA
jgi:LAO/AO transport system kinase